MTNNELADHLHCLAGHLVDLQQVNDRECHFLDEAGSRLRADCGSEAIEVIQELCGYLENIDYTGAPYENARKFLFIHGEQADDASDGATAAQLADEMFASEPASTKKKAKQTA